MARGKAKEKGKILERQHEALELRKQGKSYRAIGERLGISRTQAYDDINNELKELAANNAVSANELKQLELERLDRIISGLDHWVQAGNAPAAMAILKAMEIRSKLLGLFEPEKTEVKIATWEDRAIDEIKNGTLGYEELVDEFGADLATQLFKRAGVPVKAG